MTFSTQIKLYAYSELTGLNENEALGKALALAIMFERLKEKYDYNKAVKIIEAKHPLQVRLELEQEKRKEKH